jgi:hypothetical protein
MRKKQGKPELFDNHVTMLLNEAKLGLGTRK